MSEVPLLRSDEEAVAAAAALADELRPGAADRDRAGGVPREALAALDRSGLVGITVPREHGGAEVSHVALAEVIRLIAAADPAIAQGPQGHFLFVDVLRQLGTADQHERVFADVLAGRRLGNALAERGTKHAMALQTRLSKGDDGVLRLDGRKYYCTGAATSHRIAVTALDDTDAVVAAFVLRDAPGVSVEEDWNAMGQRATASGTTILDGAAVEEGLVLPYSTAYTGPQLLGARAQLVHAAIEVGIAGGAFADAVTFVREKSRPYFEAAGNGYERASDDPHVLHRTGELSARLHAAEGLLERAGRVLDGLPHVPATREEAAKGSLAVAEAKAFGSEAAVAISSDLFALAGTSAVDDKHDLHRHWRNARTHSVHDPIRWKYHHVGAGVLNDAVPPNHGQI
ncbi:SfnB family sulfur acquisition oxidoreductase [Patulibacter minatonensis]|uniref:SfnB family sulfur acquisition oxidoreductase n=1 Tax=Patulibacter minatonensis TaxID=298163 RepID=UPI00047D9A1B|nr:SfnB family sulfur acquisition oxidoreductase [Patulibacter minatonensis]